MCLAAVWLRAANAPSSLVWDSKADKVTADVHEESFGPLLEECGPPNRTGHMFVEPRTPARKLDVKSSKDHPGLVKSAA